MCRECHRHRHNATVENDRLLREKVNGRRSIPEIPITPQMIRPSRVQCDQDDVGKVFANTPRAANSKDHQDDAKRNDDGRSKEHVTGLPRYEIPKPILHLCHFITGGRREKD